MLLVNLFLVCLAIGLDAANEQRVEQGDWVFNQKPNSFEISGSRLTANRETSYVFYALYRGIVANETNRKYYWEFNCVQSCSSVGVAKDNNDSGGRGAFFSGYLHNYEYSYEYSFDFGDYIEDGDRIGFILDAGEQELKIYIVQNDRPLGLAYIQKAPYASELYPVATFYKSPAIVEINEKKNVNTDHLLVRTDYLEKGIQGDYKLVKMNGTVPKMEGYFLRLCKLEDRWDRIPAYLKLGNHVWTSSYTPWSYIVKWDKDAEGDIYGFRTRNPWLMERASLDSESPESKKFISAIKKLKRMKFSDNFDNLTIISTDPDTTLLFKRFLGERPHLETTNLAP